MHLSFIYFCHFFRLETPYSTRMEYREWDYATAVVGCYRKVILSKMFTNSSKLPVGNQLMIGSVIFHVLGMRAHPEGWGYIELCVLRIEYLVLSITYPKTSRL